MHDLLLRLATRYLAPALLALSLVVLYRGHNLPGGGFIGGLTAAAALLLVALAEGWATVRRRIRLAPTSWMLLGLATAGLSGLAGAVAGRPVFTGLWLPDGAPVALGTPLLFDVGVYLTVLGFTLQCARALDAEES